MWKKLGIMNENKSSTNLDLYNNFNKHLEEDKEDTENENKDISENLQKCQNELENHQNESSMLDQNYQDEKYSLDLEEEKFNNVAKNLELLTEEATKLKNKWKERKECIGNENEHYDESVNEELNTRMHQIQSLFNCMIKLSLLDSAQNMLTDLDSKRKEMEDKVICGENEIDSFESELNTTEPEIVDEQDITNCNYLKSAIGNCLELLEKQIEELKQDKNSDYINLC